MDMLFCFNKKIRAKVINKVQDYWTLGSRNWEIR